MVAIITAIYGDYDDLKPVVKQDIPVTWVCVTDRARDAQGWEIIVEPKSPHVSSRLASKIPKCLPWEFTNQDSSIWIDASFRVLSPSFAREASALANPIAQYVHASRRCVFDEARFSHDFPKYADEPLLRQAAHYQELGHPKDWGLWATGVIARKHSTQIKTMGQEWLAQIMRWSTQCQISEANCLRQADLRPTSFPGSFASGWMQYEASALHGNELSVLPVRRP